MYHYHHACDSMVAQYLRMSSIVPILNMPVNFYAKKVLFIVNFNNLCIDQITIKNTTIMYY